jgi:FixJ family two-component response regulator
MFVQKETMSGTHWVYVVDDDPSICSALTRLIRSFGYNVQTFDSAREFLKYQPRRPACVVADVCMPGPDGLDLRDALQRSQSAIPLILLTGLWEHARLDRTKGPVDVLEVLAKPVAEASLLKAIERALVIDSVAARRVEIRIGETL